MIFEIKEEEGLDFESLHILKMNLVCIMLNYLEKYVYYSTTLNVQAACNFYKM